MIHFPIDEHLRILANTDDELVLVYGKKVATNAMANGHDMQIRQEPGSKCVMYCGRCPFEHSVWVVSKDWHEDCDSDDTYCYVLGTDALWHDVNSICPAKDKPCPKKP